MLSLGTKMLSSYINCPFKPDGQPANVQIREPEPRNILTAMGENESVVKKETDPERKAIALAWLFHLWVTYTNHYTQRSLFSVEYPNGIEVGTKSVCG